MVVENNYMKALDKAEKDKQKELDEMYEELEAGDITEYEYDKKYEEVEKEYEEQLDDIDEEYGMK
jgi:neutral trehalase